MSINAFPAAIQAILQNNTLERTFEEALVPNFVFRMAAEREEIEGGLGETRVYTKTGLLAPVTTPLTPGNDPTPQAYTIEQYSLTLSQYANSVDTNMLTSAVALASKYLEDIKKLGINAAQSLNRIARDKFFKAYLSGNTWAVGAGSSSTDLVVNDITGFTTKLVNGVQTAISADNKLDITVGSTAAVVVGYNATTKHLTLETAITWSDGDAVVATNAPQIIRAGSRASAKAVTATDTCKLSHFLDAVAVLRSNNVPTVDGFGNYVAMIDPVSERSLFADADFREAFRGTGMTSEEWKRLQVATFAGLTWVRNTEQPIYTNAAGVRVHRPCVLGYGALKEGRLKGQENLLAEANTGLPEVRRVDDVVMITRPPLDRLGQVIANTWSFVGDYAAPTDWTLDSTTSTTANASQYKRGVIIEHA